MVILSIFFAQVTISCMTHLVTFLQPRAATAGKGAKKRARPKYPNKYLVKDLSCIIRGYKKRSFSKKSTKGGCLKVLPHF